MFIYRTALAVVLMASLAISAHPADPPRAAPPSKEQIAKWVKQLGADEFDSREEASKKLWEAGQAAEDAVAAATKDDDPEIRERSGKLVDKFKWGIYPDTPKGLLELITKYQAAEGAARLEMLRSFLDEGAPGCRSLLKILNAEPEQAVRLQIIVVMLARELPRAMPKLLKEQQYTFIEQFLDVALEADFENSISHYVAYWRLRERIDERIALHTKLEGKENKRQAEILTYLQRGKGDAPAALAAARRSGNDKLIDGMLFESGSWKELAFRGNALDGETRAEQLAHRATFHRLAGNLTDAKENQAEMRRYQATLSPRRDDNGQAMTIAKAFFVNDMPDDALESLKVSESWVMAYEILIARLRFAEADALVEKLRAPDVVPTPDFAATIAQVEILQARTWCLLGEKAKALPVFARYAGRIAKDEVSATWLEDLVDAEFRAGLTDEAFDHAARILELDSGDIWPLRLLQKLFPRQKSTALALYGLLRQTKPNPDPAAILKRLRMVLGGKATQKEVGELLDQLAPLIESQKNANDVRRMSLLSDGDVSWKALAELAQLAGLDARSQTFLETADTVESLIELGDRQASKKQWEAAARWYQKAWDKERNQPLALYLQGHALVQAGKEKEGREDMQYAHWLPLGDDSARHAFAVELLKRNQNRDSRRENDINMHIGEIGGWYSAEALRRNALDALSHKEYFVCADAHERAMLRVLRANTNFLQSSSYLGVPSLIHRYRAVGLVKAGKTAEAIKEAELALTLLPSDLDPAIYLVPELEALGKKDEAARLYQRSRATYEQLCKDFPRSTLGHNGVAWLSACCHRDLDDALVHARKAVELDPTNSSYLDTMAEVYFQLGQKDKAVEAQKKAVALAPKRAYLRKQLQRIEAGDPKAQRPDENDDDDDDD